MSLRAQTSVEFLILVSFVLFFFVSFLMLIGYSTSDKVYERQSLAIQQVARTIQEEVALAHATEDGYEREFSLPLQIVNLDYEIEIVGGSVYVHTVNGRHALSVPIEDVTGSFAPGDNVIRRANDIIYVNG